MFYSGDPERDHEQHEAYLQRELEKRPVCSECDQYIQDDECYEFNGELICPECLREYHRKWTDDYIE